MLDNIGLVISTKKTKNMLVGEHPTPKDVSVDHKKVEEVENFTCLGSPINNSGDTDHELKWQIRKAAVAFN